MRQVQCFQVRHGSGVLVAEPLGAEPNQKDIGNGWRRNYLEPIKSRASTFLFPFHFLLSERLFDSWSIVPTPISLSLTLTPSPLTQPPSHEALADDFAAFTVKTVDAKARGRVIHSFRSYLDAYRRICNLPIG